MTTAQKLIAYRKELKAAGMDDELINDLVRDAGQTLVLHQGLDVTQDTPPSPQE